MTKYIFIFLLPAIVPTGMVVGSRLGGLATMRGFVATTATQYTYNETFPVPAIGDLHRVFIDLPSPCEVIRDLSAFQHTAPLLVSPYATPIASITTAYQLHRVLLRCNAADKCHTSPMSFRR
jgi:hypothetical protein